MIAIKYKRMHFLLFPLFFFSCSSTSKICDTINDIDLTKNDFNGDIYARTCV